MVGTTDHSSAIGSLDHVEPGLSMTDSDRAQINRGNTGPTTITTTTSTYKHEASKPATSKTTTTAKPSTQSAAPIVAGALYVSSSGNDGGDGSAASPFRTIQRAISLAPSGSTIIVKAGTYNEKLVINGKSGLTIRNEAGVRPILSGAGFSSGYLIDISGSSQIVFSGFEVCDFKGSTVEGILIRKASRNVEISNNRFHDIGTTQSSGNAHVILASGGSNTPITGITVKNNEIYSCNTGRSESITMESNVDGFSITGNKIHDVTNIAIDAAGFYDHGVTSSSMNQARNGVIASNLIYNVSCPYASCAAIYVDGGRDIVIERNTIYNAMYGIEVGCENPVDQTTPSVRASVRNVTVRYNTIYKNSRAGLVIGGYDGTATGQVVNSKAYNNTLYMNRTELVLSYCDSITLSKNIFFGIGGERDLIYNDSGNAVTNLVMSNNIYMTDIPGVNFEFGRLSAHSLTEWQNASGQDLDSRFIDPLFVNRAANNFNLQSGSPAIGFGSK